MSLDDDVSRAHDAMHSEPHDLDEPDRCECGEVLTFDDDVCAECRALIEADDRATYERDCAEMNDAAE